MIYTTYFANLRKLPPHIVPISIAAVAPQWYTGIRFRALYPKYDFFQKWKETGDDAYYVSCYNDEVLSELNPDRTEAQLISFANSINVALVCYEKPGDFCHRHLVAEWFNNNGIPCKEWDGKE